jgi:hypothetical protein
VQPVGPPPLNSTEHCTGAYIHTYIHTLYIYIYIYIYIYSPHAVHMRNVLARCTVYSSSALSNSLTQHSKGTHSTHARAAQLIRAVHTARVHSIKQCCLVCSVNHRYTACSTASGTVNTARAQPPCTALTSCSCLRSTAYTRCDGTRATTLQQCTRCDCV